MKKALRIPLFLLGFCVFAVLSAVLLPDPFGSAYQRSLVRQYDVYNSLQDNKIVFMGSSSLSFGFDLNTMEELTGKPCAILGNHFGYGLTYLMEMSKSNLKSGDVVVLEIVENSIDTCSEELLLTGIGHRYEMYRFFIPQTRWKIVSSYPAYLKKVLLYDLGSGYDPGEGPYTIRSFDARGNFIYERTECLIPTPFTEENAGKYFMQVKLDGTPYQAAFVDYVNKYISDCESMGVAVYLTLPCYYREAVLSSEEDLEAFENMLRASFDAPIISRQADYFFDLDLLYDSIMHCNTEGAKRRTELLYRDLLTAEALE